MRAVVRNEVRRADVRKDVPVSTLTSKGQITLPREIRQHLGIDAGDRINFIISEAGEVVVEPETIDLKTLRSVLRRTGRKVSLTAMERAIQRGATGK